jgi:hypothetical protein
LARWLVDNVPAAVPLEEVPEDADLWEVEKQWIAKLAGDGPLFNKLGNPAWSPRRRGGPAN